MKYHVYALILFWGIPIFTYAEVQITEVAWMGTAQSQYSEWIELYNSSDEEIDLSGWKLFKAGSTLLFGLTKSIGPQQYLLVERTTPSAPDAVPGIDDEAGAFGGGGLSNSGEDLVLKDGSGATVEALEYASGWPAGEAKSKQTMQRDGDTWVTADPTPKEGLSSSSGGTTRAAAKEVDPNPIPSVSPNKPHIAFVVPQTIYRGVPYQFEAQPVLEFNYRITKGVFYWNMGDGTIIRQTELAPVMHTYQYPGTYTISFLFTDTTNQFPPLRGSKKIAVALPTLSTTIVDGRSIVIQNTAAVPVDLSGWSMMIDGVKFSIPEMTIVAEKASITLPSSIWGIGQVAHATLVDPSGTVLTSKQLLPAVRTVQNEQATYTESVEEVFDDQQIQKDAFEDGTSPSTTHNRTKKILFGAVVVFVIGLSILLERAMARREYQ